MKRTVVYAAALAAMLALGVPGKHVLGQGPGPNSSGYVPGGQTSRSLMSSSPKSGSPMTSNSMSGSPMSKGLMSGNQMSGGHMPGPGGAEQYAGEFSSDGWSSGEYGGGSCTSGSCSSCGDFGCCDECEYGCNTGCGSSWWDSCGIVGGQPRWYFVADYLYVRASVSESVAYIERFDDDLADRRDVRHELNFQHQSSYRFGGGYRLDCCDEEVRFMFTRLSSGASTVAPPGTLVPYEVFSADDDTSTFISADVDVKSFDLDFRKTIPLGGSACCECSDSCDSCGCGDACCAPSCPAWDITWSGGVRFADVDWRRNYDGVFEDGSPFRSATPTLDFTGGGPRVGLEGRRYFGKSNWCSIFLRGDISLLLGQMEQKIVRVDENDFRTTLTDRGRRIIPVTEIEAGLSSQLTKNSRFSAGYLFSAWHDLGFRDQFDLQTLVESNTTDTANILGFDGLFVRLEVGY
jgi:Legionella pneumophila major outer membrane protein precursor